MLIVTRVRAPARDASFSVHARRNIFGFAIASSEVTPIARATNSSPACRPTRTSSTFANEFNTSPISTASPKRAHGVICDCVHVETERATGLAMVPADREELRTLSILERHANFVTIAPREPWFAFVSDGAHLEQAGQAYRRPTLWTSRLRPVRRDRDPSCAGTPSRRRDSW
jgi:hypothetical protein